MTSELLHGDCLEVLKQYPSDHFHSTVTDPPYGLKFMGRAWDHGVPSSLYWQEIMRVAKPGSILLAFGGTRTYHRLACAVEDAGWELRDCIMWIYGSGFPKGLNVGLAIDKATRGVPQGGVDGTSPNHGKYKGGCSDDNPSGQGFGAGPGSYMQESGQRNRREFVELARPWSGWNTTLKPAYEPILVAQKPMESTVADNVLKHGVGAFNIDACRIPYVNEADKASATPQGKCTSKNSGAIGAEPDAGRDMSRVDFERPELLGRWPANVIHDGSEEVLSLFPETSSGTGAIKKASSAGANGNTGAALGAESRVYGTPMICYGDAGSAARFFYCAKAPKSDRGEGNNWTTVKPTELMRYLCRLVTPPNGTILDPFMGSGSTGKAAQLEGFNFVGIDKEQEAVAIAQTRVSAELNI